MFRYPPTRLVFTFVLACNCENVNLFFWSVPYLDCSFVSVVIIEHMEHWRKKIYVAGILSTRSSQQRQWSARSNLWIWWWRWGWRSSSRRILPASPTCAQLPPSGRNTTGKFWYLLIFVDIPPPHPSTSNLPSSVRVLFLFYLYFFHLKM